MDPPPDYATLRKAGWSALNAQDLADADRIFIDLETLFPTLPGGLAGRARVAQGHRQWQHSIDLFDACLTQFPRAPIAPDWLCAKARSLGELGRLDDADAILAPLVAETPANAERTLLRAQILDRADPTRARDAWQAVLNLHSEHPVATLRYLYHLGRPSPPREALAEIRTGRFAGQTRFEVLLQAARFATRCGELDYLRDILGPLIAQAPTAADCTALLPLIPLAHEGWACTAAWLALDQRCHTLHPANETPEATILAMRLRLALKDHPGFLRLIETTNLSTLGTWAPKLQRHAELLRTPADHTAPKIFGIGLSKTGTTSLDAALNQLGYLSTHWINTFTCELLTPADAFLFDALTDTPTCMFVEALAHTFPNSRFVYTTRPMDSWLDSYQRHATKYHTSTDFAVMRNLVTPPGAYHFGAPFARQSVPLFYRYDTPQQAREAYEHRIAAFFTGDRAARLLTLDAFSTNGWQDLCAFLDKPTPDTPYPRENADHR